MIPIQEVILVLTIGFSPSGSASEKLNTQIYPQFDMISCIAQEKHVNTFNDGRFDYHAICITRIKDNE